MSGQLALGVLLVSGLLSAGTPKVPFRLQVAIIHQIMAQDRMPGEGQATILYVHTARSTAALTTALHDFKDAGISALPMDITEIAQARPNFTRFAYVTADAASEEVGLFLVANHILSVGESRELVETGQAAISIQLSSKGTPEIIINIKRLQAEGHALPDTLLELATIIRGGSR